MSKKDKLLLTFLGFLVIVAFIGGQMWNSYKDFSKEKWVNYEGNSRQAIVKDFFDRTIVDGISEDELKGYLGEPDDSKEGELIYYLGTPRGFFGDKEGPEEQLVFTFQDGKAIGVTRVPVSAQASE
ncbi:hypothetical protein [Anaerotignum propionicum]|uniref:hypothetical protein n=1 Tax=Anaerotignum propionicum TaxID=28446 RepID=UPI0028975DB7|nr:hypothetical protein [Anaerotignum propionicum]